MSKERDNRDEKLEEGQKSSSPKWNVTVSTDSSDEQENRQSDSKEKGQGGESTKIADKERDYAKEIGLSDSTDEGAPSSSKIVGGGDEAAAKEIEIEEHSVVPEKQPLWVTMFAIVGVFIGAMFLMGALIAVFGSKESIDKGFVNFLNTLVVFSITIVFAVRILIARGAERPIFRFVPKKPNSVVVLWGFVLLMLSSIVFEPLLNLIPDTNQEALGNLVNRGWWGFATTIFLVPVVEEILFRGIIQESVMREYGKVRGLLFAAFIFALAHIAVPQQAVGAFFGGLILGYVYYRTRSLIPVIIIHILNNAVAYLMMTIFDVGIVTLSDLVSNNVLYWILYGVSTAIFVVAVVALVIQLRQEDKQEYKKVGK